MYEAFCFLVVDDHPAVRMIIKEILRGFGAGEIELAPDGASALKLLKARPFDLLITDMVMPGIGGVELARTVRSGRAAAKPDIPIIMLSGNLDRPTLLAARNAGVNEFVVKPVVVAHLQARIEACLRRPRPYIAEEGYKGPCRRRKAGEFPFAERRQRRTF